MRSSFLEPAAILKNLEFRVIGMKVGEVMGLRLLGLGCQAKNSIRARKTLMLKGAVRVKGCYRVFIYTSSESG